MDSMSGRVGVRSDLAGCRLPAIQQSGELVAMQCAGGLSSICMRAMITNAVMMP